MSDPTKPPTHLADQKLEEQVRSLLKPLRHSVPEASPFMKTRVMARLREEERAKAGWSLSTFWKPALASSAAAALLVIVWNGREAQGPVFPATAGQPVAVKVEMPEKSARKVVFAQVELPRGVRFYSKSFPAIGEKTSLDLAWKESPAPSALPIIVKAEEKGIKTVKVKFFDDDRKLIGERQLKINFEKEGSQV
ncbi:MAG: hypothetical protein NDJ89_01280 [Oligoflexia bacterium]|nr:hypothetical protein [Oligoflexia bacterium]